ncbi:uncharacterized protein LOC117224571 isoform X1 [Megalopta genalis]|uniref:uncharacterized protein LOC117224571 isoform X1 n=1 Tax=Megalopta genalis TaxID=115081 RepID=UPI003FD418B4
MYGGKRREGKGTSRGRRRKRRRRRRRKEEEGNEEEKEKGLPSEDHASAQSPVCSLTTRNSAALRDAYIPHRDLAYYLPPWPTQPVNIPLSRGAQVGHAPHFRGSAIPRFHGSTVPRFQGSTPRFHVCASRRVSPLYSPPRFAPPRRPTRPRPIETRSNIVLFQDSRQSPHHPTNFQDLTPQSARVRTFSRVTPLTERVALFPARSEARSVIYLAPVSPLYALRPTPYALRFTLYALEGTPFGSARVEWVRATRNHVFFLSRSCLFSEFPNFLNVDAISDSQGIVRTNSKQCKLIFFSRCARFSRHKI